MNKVVRNKNFVGVLLALLTFGFYMRTLAPTVDFIDSGELAAVATTLGIAHPTGYPLFTLVGWLFAHLPLGFRTIYQLNLMSAVLCSASIFLFYKLFLFLLSDKPPFQPSKLGDLARLRQVEQVNAREERHNVIAAASGTLILAFSETFWSQAVSIEVYSLHLLLLSGTILTFLKAIQEKLTNSAEAKSAWWYSFAFVLGLGFTNHMTTILLAPGFLYLYFATKGFSREAWKSILEAVVPFLVGFSVYCYLPFRASQSPVFNWGNPATLEKFWWHFTGKQYRVWIFSSFESAEKQLLYFLQSFPSEFAYLPLVLAVPGVVYLFRSTRKIFFFTVILLVSCVLYSINYDIHDIDSYFLLAYVTTVIWIVVGAQVFLGYAARRSLIAELACMAAAVVPLILHYNSADESQNYAVEDYTRNMFDSLEPNALVLSYQWDYFVSASYYYQFVEGLRNDVAVVDKELLRRSWYFKELEHRYPWLIQNSKTEVDAFMKELDKFEHDLPYNSVVIQARFEEMIRSFLERNYDSRPLYVTVEIEPEFFRGFQKIPAGLAFRLFHDTTFHPIQPREFTFRPFPKTNKYVEGIKSMYATSYTNQGVYLGMLGDRNTALEFFRKALLVKPDFPDARAWMQRFSGER